MATVVVVELSAKGKSMDNTRSKAVWGQMRLSDHYLDEVELLRNGDGDCGSGHSLR